MPDDLQTVRSGYDRWAAVYDHDGNPLVALEGPRMRAAVGAPGGLRALDLGCGTGRHALWLAEAGAVVTAMDFSPGMLAAAQAKPGAAQVTWVRHDLHEPLPWADGSFDLVVSGLVLEHLGDLPRFFREVRRVLLPGGRAVLSAMHPAMFDHGVQARFTDPHSGEKIQPGSLAHSLADFLAAASAAGFLAQLEEYAPDAAFSEQFPRAAKHVGRPMLALLLLT